MLPKFTSQSELCPNCHRWHSLERTHRPFWVRKMLFFVKTRGYVCNGCRKKVVQIGRTNHAVGSDLFI